ncbi:hypothetical protein ACSSS7_004669 [Eimeria intestinalis]
MFRMRRLLLCCSSCVLAAVALTSSPAAAAAAASTAAAAVDAQWVEDGVASLGYEERTITNVEDPIYYGDATRTASDTLSDLYHPDSERSSKETSLSEREKEEQSSEEEYRDAVVHAALAAASMAISAMQETEKEAVDQAFIRAQSLVRAHRHWTFERAISLFHSTITFVFFLSISSLPPIALALMSAIALITTILNVASVFMHLSLARANEQRLAEVREAYEAGKLDPPTGGIRILIESDSNNSNNNSSNNSNNSSNSNNSNNSSNNSNNSNSNNSNSSSSSRGGAAMNTRAPAGKTQFFL